MTLNTLNTHTSSEVAAAIGRAIRKARKELDLTATLLARKADVDIAQLSHWECGRIVPTLPVLIKLAVALECTLSSLVATAENDLGQRRSNG